MDIVVDDAAGVDASVGITLLALAIFGYVKGHFTGASTGTQLHPNDLD